MSEQIYQERRHTRRPQEQTTEQSHAEIAEATQDTRSVAESASQEAERTLESITATLEYLGELATA